ncbi:MAG: hypothetical protein FRX49_13671 [Trebouxia sp. A1-2]|nr:MAG: hypothetical protein FRX49_13671 [Trebouxia sp. A1-2]
MRIPKTDRHQVRLMPGILQSDAADAITHRLRKCRTRHKYRVQAGFIQYLKDPTISPILTSTLIAAGTVSFNLVAGLVTEKKRADLQLEVEQQRNFAKAQQELQSLTARYRGPLLEAVVDLENRMWHLANATSEWQTSEGRHEYSLKCSCATCRHKVHTATPLCNTCIVSEQEVMYTLFNLAQFLGYVEVVRREGPREDAFLQAGNPQGSDTLATLVEGLRFVMSAASGNLVDWGDVSEPRDHPGSRTRRTGEDLIEWTPIQQYQLKVDDQLRVPRGTQRAIGALMLTTPSGSDRHYTMDFAQFCDRYTKDPVFAEWLKPSHDDIINLAIGDNWKGQGPFPMGRWSRVLLLQQMLIDAEDLLDPTYVRVPKARRTRLMPIEYGPLPALSEYQRKLRRLARSTTIGEYSRSLNDVSKWSKSVSSIDEAQLEAMRKHLGGQSTKTHSSRANGKAVHESRHEM